MSCRRLQSIQSFSKDSYWLNMAFCAFCEPARDINLPVCSSDHWWGWGADASAAGGISSPPPLRSHLAWTVAPWYYANWEPHPRLWREQTPQKQSTGSGKDAAVLAFLGEREVGVCNKWEARSGWGLVFRVFSCAEFFATSNTLWNICHLEFSELVCTVNISCERCNIWQLPVVEKEWRCERCGLILCPVPL